MNSKVTLKVSIDDCSHPLGISLTIVLSALSQPPAGNIGDPAPREGQGRGTLPIFVPVELRVTLNVPAAGYISDASNASFWNIDYYQHHFDVDTKTVGSPFCCYS